MANTKKEKRGGGLPALTNEEIERYMKSGFIRDVSNRENDKQQKKEKKPKTK